MSAWSILAVVGLLLVALGAGRHLAMAREGGFSAGGAALALAGAALMLWAEALSPAGVGADRLAAALEAALRALTAPAGGA
ncbi:hypothetical protein [Oceanicella actignis]|uniref:Uncharacterized protein n=1 Tax=Oceanicella actignis TaxID=1189325 RepID=A0A1M7SNT1_9RHOB|nr:hypothetical protein [Oceanicella actignis]SES64654.1 hypothetical protein SAMN04488119_10121 [Oceanicella actignis]SHN60056.1 hypothetical protein SAMN05216200_10322 [Oceanicella actignis]